MQKHSTPLAIVVNFNQEHEVGNFLQKLTTNYPTEHICFVDDCSTDNSMQIISHFKLNVIKHAQNMGVGAAIRTGINYAFSKNYDSVVILSSNGKMKPEDLNLITKDVIDGSADYVTGSRFMNKGSSPGISFFRRSMIPLFSIASSLLLRKRFTDITCGYRCYKISFLNHPNVNINQEWLNRYEMEYYIHYWACKLKLKIKEVPVVILYDHLKEGRKSKITPFIDWWSMLKPFFFLSLKFKK